MLHAHVRENDVHDRKRPEDTTLFRSRFIIKQQSSSGVRPNRHSGDRLRTHKRHVCFMPTFVKMMFTIEKDRKTRRSSDLVSLSSNSPLPVCAQTATPAIGCELINDTYASCPRS